MHIIQEVNKFLKLKTPIKLSVILIFLIAIGSSIQLVQQTKTYGNINPFGFLNDVFAQLSQQTVIGGQKEDKGGLNIGGYLGGEDADKIIAYEQSNSIQNGYSLTIVDSTSQFEQTVDFIKKMYSKRIVTIVRFCASSNCEFKFFGQEINQSHPMIDFCTKLKENVNPSSFVCTTGPNKPGNPGESARFGYTSVNLPDVVDKSIQVAKIMKSLGIRTGTFAINLTNRQNDEVSALFGSPAFLSNKAEFDFVLANIYDTVQATAVEEYTKTLNIGGNQKSLQNFIEENGLKVIFTEFGTLSTKPDNLETLKRSTKYMCELSSTKGLILFRSFKELMDLYPGLIDNPTATDSAGNLRWPVQFLGNDVADILSPCNNLNIVSETQSALLEFPIISNAERCALFNPRNGKIINDINNCSYLWQSKAGFNMGDIPSADALDWFRGLRDKNIPNLKLGSVLLLGLNTSSIPQLAKAIIEANQRGYMPIVRFCYRNQPNCDLTFDPAHPLSFAKACEQLYLATEEAQAQFICPVGPNEPSLEHGSYANVSLGNLPNYRPMVEGANKMADYLQKYRDRMYLAPALLNASSCGDLDDVTNYLYSSFAINPRLFDYILANIYTLPEKDAYVQFAATGKEGICDRPYPSIKAYVETHGLKFIATEFARWDQTVSKQRFEKDVENLCKDPSVDYFLYFDSLKFGPYEGLDFSGNSTRATHPTIPPEDAVRYSEMCLKNHPWVEFNFDTLIYPESKGESRAKTTATKYTSKNNSTNNANSQLLLTCDQLTCTGYGLRTVRVVSQTKGESSHVGTNKVNFPTLSQTTSGLINLTHIDTLSKFSALANISGKEYPIPYLGSYFNHTELLKYTIYNLDPRIQQVNPHPASFAVNSRLKLIKDKRNGLFRGDNYLDEYFLIDNLLHRGSFHEAKFLEYKREYLREYDPFVFEHNKVEVISSQPRNIVFDDIQNEIHGPEVVIDEIALSVPSVDVCYEYAIRNTSRQKNRNIQVFGKPQCDIKTLADDSNIYTYLNIKGTCQYILGVTPQSFCSNTTIDNGTCLMNESLFKSCYKFTQMLEGSAYLNTTDYFEPTNFEVNEVYSSLYKLYTIINDNLYTRGLRLNTGDVIISSKASVDSYIRDINLAKKLGVQEKPGLYAPVPEQLNYSMVDYETMQVKSSATAYSADLFKNNASVPRGTAYKRFDYAINYLGFLSFFSEILTTYLNDGAIPALYLPDEEASNPFYGKQSVCSVDKFLCRKKHIISSGSAEMLNRLPLFTCDEYYLNQNYTLQSLRELGIVNGIDFENDSRYSFFASQVQNAFKLSLSDQRLPCLETLDYIQKPGVVEKELCARAYPVRGVCTNSCLPSNNQSTYVANGQTSNQLTIKTSCPMPSQHACFQGPYGSYTHCDISENLPVDLYPQFTRRRDIRVVSPEDGKIIEVNMNSSTRYGNLGRSIVILGNSGIRYHLKHIANDLLHKEIIQSLRSGPVSVNAGQHIGNLCTRGKDNTTSDSEGACIYDFNNIHLHIDAQIAGNVIDPYAIFGEIMGCNLKRPEQDMKQGTTVSSSSGYCYNYNGGKPFLNDNSCKEAKPASNISNELLKNLLSGCNIQDSTLSECTRLREAGLSNQSITINDYLNFDSTIPPGNIGFCSLPSDENNNESSSQSSKCNEFNCALSNPNNDIFENSLSCAVSSLSTNISTRNLNLAQVIDRYGPFCDNEVRGASDNLISSMPFAYNLFVGFYDKYKPPGTPGGRTCAEAPPNKVRDEDAKLRKTCDDFPRKSGTFASYEDEEAFDYYRGALVRCGLDQQNMSWNKNTSSFGSFGGIDRSLGDNDSDITFKLRPMAQAIKNSDINYLNIARLSQVPEDKILEVLKQSYKQNVNPFLVLGLWATESWFGQFNDINFKGSRPSCNFF